MARRSLFSIVGCVLALALIYETVAQTPNTSSEYLSSSADSESTEGDSWLRAGLYSVLRYAGGRFFPMRTSAGVRFNLYTRRGMERLELHQTSIKSSGYDSSNPTTVLVHGYNNKVVGLNPWLEKVAKGLLKRGPWNVIVVDWSRLCSVFYAWTVVRARRIPGLVTAELLRMLQDVKDLDLSTVHVVGFSLGAHVAGFVGQNIRGIGRITGLDPTGPLFKTAEPSKRLSPDDALFVDIVNTNAGSFIAGLSLGFNPDVDVGHVTVHLNGGVHQSGCWVGNSCSHFRAMNYFIESLQLDEDFLVYPCKDSDESLPVPFGLNMPHTARGCYFAAANRNEPYLQPSSPLPIQIPTAKSRDVSYDAPSEAFSSSQRRVDSQFLQLEQDSVGQEFLTDFPDIKSFFKRKQDQEPAQVLEPSHPLKPEHDLETELLFQLDPDLEPEKLLNLKHFLEPEQLLKLVHILQSKDLSKHDEVFLSEQFLEHNLFIEPEQILNLNLFPNPKQILQSVQSVTNNQVLKGDNILESFASSKPQQPVESRKPIHSSSLLPSIEDVKPVDAMLSQTPADYLREPQRSLRPVESKSFVSMVKPAKTIKLPTLSRPPNKPVQMHQILGPQKPLKPSELVRRLQAAERQTVHTPLKSPSIFDRLLPWSKSRPLGPVENYKAKLAYEMMLTQF